MFGDTMLAGKRVLITGGGTGLGLAIARQAALYGANVVLVGRRQDVLDQAAAELRGIGTLVETFSCDIRSADAVATMMDAAFATSPIDVLVNNAAGAIMAQAESLSARAFDAVLQVGLHGTIYCTIEAGKRWIGARHPGVILFTIASGVENGRAFTSPLTVAKGGVLTLMRSLAVEWGRHGIRCVGVAPGLFPTPAAAQRLHAGERNMAAHNGIPLARVGQGEELGDLCAFLMSDRAGYITGEMITIDGGRSLKGQDMDELFSWPQERWDALRPKK
jgi:NAD(P)-dependent dehydrogenase (short-subunit alcohol dehydrogenase family)